MTTDVTSLDDARLFAAEDGLHKMYAVAKAAGEPTGDLEAAFDTLTLEMAERGLVYSPLTKSDYDADHFGDDDDDDDDDTNDDRADDDGDGGTTRNDMGDMNGTRGGRPAPAKQSVGPVVKKDKYLKPSVPGNPGEHPSMDDGIHQSGKTKSGKGGEGSGVATRTQRNGGGTTGIVGGDNKTFPDDGLRQKGKKAKQNKSGEGSGIATRTQDKVAKQMRKEYKRAAAVGAYYPHVFMFEKGWLSSGLAAAGAVATGDVTGVNAGTAATCKTCGKSKAAHQGAQLGHPFNGNQYTKAEGDPNNATPDHSFHPVRNVCRICRRPMADHLGKQLGWDGSMFKAVDDDTVEDRQKGADAGLALPDGSFYIPDEAHLHQAIRLIGNATDPQAAMNHIIERAQAMGLENALPPAWLAMTAAGQPQQPMTGPGANTMAAQQGAGAPPGTPGSKVQQAGPAGPAKPPTQQPAGANVAGPAKPPKKPGAGGGGFAKRLTKAISRALGGTEFDADAFEKSISSMLDPEFEYAVVKSSAEHRFTLGPVYMPNTLDAHGEWATAEDLQKSLWEYVGETGADRTVYLQHSPRPAGQWVEVVSWPQEVNARMVKSIDGYQKAVDTTFPAGTVYMGVVWEPWAYEDVKKGKITGFSMGGYARRVETDIPGF